MSTHKPAVLPTNHKMGLSCSNCKYHPWVTQMWTITDHSDDAIEFSVPTILPPTRHYSILQYNVLEYQYHVDGVRTKGPSVRD